MFSNLKKIKLKELHKRINGSRVSNHLNYLTSLVVQFIAVVSTQCFYFVNVLLVSKFFSNIGVVQYKLGN